jgi:hypothetical protein
MIPIDELPLRPLVMAPLDTVLASSPPAQGPTAPPAPRQPAPVPAAPRPLPRPAPPPPVPPLAGRVELGGPHAVPITPDLLADDPDLRLFVTQDAARCVYHLVRLTLNFPAQPTTPHLDSVHVRIELTAPGGGEPPVAWSMSEVTDVRQRVRRLVLGPRLGILGIEAELGEVSREVTEHDQVPFVRAEGVQTPRPAWRFTRTPTRRLIGNQQLAMVVRAPTGVPTTLSLEINAATRSRIIRRYRDLPSPLRLGSPFPLV